MPTGSRNYDYIGPSTPHQPLEVDNSYFCVRLHDTQAFFPAGAFTKPKFLLFSTEVKSSFQPEHAAQSLHQLAVLQKNVPCHLGINTNLTDWLPAYHTDNLSITLKYTVVQNTPLKTLLERLGQLDLSAPVSLVRPDWATAIKVTQIAGNILGWCLKEGGQTDIFQMEMTLNLANLQAGYYAVIGSSSDESWPSQLKISTSGRLTDKNDHELSRFSYAVIQVLAIPRRGLEALRVEPWGELLQIDLDKALSAASGSEELRREALTTWQANLLHLHALAARDRSFLEQEIVEIFDKAQLEVEQKLRPGITHEAGGLDFYSNELRKALGVSTPEELRHAVREYQDALERSKSLLEQYNLLQH